MRPTIARMKHLIALAAVALCGCTSMQYNDGERLSINYPAGYPHAEVDAEATAACVKAGKRAAVRINTVDQYRMVPSFIDNNVAAFRCV